MSRSKPTRPRLRQGPDTVTRVFRPASSSALVPLSLLSSLVYCSLFEGRNDVFLRKSNSVNCSTTH